MKLTDLCLWKKVNDQKEQDKRLQMCSECIGQYERCCSYQPMQNIQIKDDKGYIGKLKDYLTKWK